MFFFLTISIRIPLICSLSRSKFFLLPCCSFDFFGKFQRKSNKTTIYREYLVIFIRDLIDYNCGMVRICCVGSSWKRTDFESLRRNEYALLVDVFNIRHKSTNSSTLWLIKEKRLKLGTKSPANTRTSFNGLLSHLQFKLQVKEHT